MELFVGFDLVADDGILHLIIPRVTPLRLGGDLRVNGGRDAVFERRQIPGIAPRS